MPDVVLRPAKASDAADIARILRAALAAFDWMPQMHTPDEDLRFVRHVLLAKQHVTVATVEGKIVGFAAVRNEWIEQLYLDPAWNGRGIGNRLLRHVTVGMTHVKLFCFQANKGARRFYEREGFVAEAFGEGSANEEGLPDMLYVRHNMPAAEANSLQG
ncbi:ribosomal protein S18 acetylase RimI-like enzyme [Aminobacter lissarensis]|uniref:Ribosomal protein S18 acetylase RimI-like enzyme n=1 Tax=Aminobacter carboxidus TaxID=376165 RepID=A0A8E1WCL1_9HYPH|nr:GNAT family N-acetyltransferase [Aminobacter lissarensis]MBB6465902.1 ribosomal protein S18 acetylase RimI-like enzyme [Aminobacter lissarensis]